ncbi:MAG: succinate dehydrogenase cytochrome b subunit [Verrucomicrobiota bacterium]
MKLIGHIFGSSLGKKYVMAISGCVLFLFVVGHLVGNLQVFLGPESINRYGHFLQSNLEVIWPARLVLLLMVGLHIWSAIRLSLENRSARPVPYGDYQPAGASYASRTMMWSGVIVLAFIVYHLMHYTLVISAINGTGKDFMSRPEFFDSEGRHDIFRMLVVGFSNPWVSGFYILAMGLLCLHLSHGISAMVQSLGLTLPAYRRTVEFAAGLVAGLIFLGYASIPTAILLGFGKEALK